MKNIIYRHKKTGLIITHQTLFDLFNSKEQAEITFCKADWKNDELQKYTYWVKLVPFSNDFEVITLTGLEESDIVDCINAIHLYGGDLTTKMEIIKVLEKDLKYLYEIKRGNL